MREKSADFASTHSAVRTTWQDFSALVPTMQHDIHLIVDRLREYKFEEDLTLVTFGMTMLVASRIPIDSDV